MINLPFYGMWFCLFFGRNFSGFGSETKPHTKRNDANALHTKDICGDLDSMPQTSNFVARNDLEEYKTRCCRPKTWALHHKKKRFKKPQARQICVAIRI